MKTRWKWIAFMAVLATWVAEPAHSDHQIVPANFVPWEEMMEHCLPHNARSVGCFADGQVWLVEVQELKGFHSLALALDFVSWRDLERICDEPACEVDGAILAHRSFDKAMNCAVGEIVFKQQQWPDKLFNTQCILGHEIVHAFGGAHPVER